MESYFYTILVSSFFFLIAFLDFHKLDPVFLIFTIFVLFTIYTLVVFNENYDILPPPQYSYHVVDTDIIRVDYHQKDTVDDTQKVDSNIRILSDGTQAYSLSLQGQDNENTYQINYVTENSEEILFKISAINGHNLNGNRFILHEQGHSTVIPYSGKFHIWISGRTHIDFVIEDQIDYKTQFHYHFDYPLNTTFRDASVSYV